MNHLVQFTVFSASAVALMLPASAQLSLVAHYEMNETAGTICVDSSGNGNHGTYTGGHVLGQAGSSPASGTAVDFDGVSGHVDIQGSPSLDALNSNLSIAAWIEADVERLQRVFANRRPSGGGSGGGPSVDGDVVRASGIGSWKQGKSAWARLDRWAPWLAPADARPAYAALLRAWLAAFGPARVDDFVWWSGLTKRDAKLALEDLGADVVAVEVRGWSGPRFALAGPLEDDGPPVGVALLPALDPSAMCWTDRSPFLDPSWSRSLWDNTGNVAPTIWVDGRVVGGWACRPDGTVVARVLDPTAAAHEDAVRDEAALLTAALGGLVVTPRFPTPLTKELASP